MRREAFAGSRPVARRLVEELGTVWVDSARGCLCCVFRVAPRSTLAVCMSIGERVGRWSLHAPKVRRFLNSKSTARKWKPVELLLVVLLLRLPTGRLAPLIRLLQMVLWPYLRRRPYHLHYC